MIQTVAGAPPHIGPVDGRIILQFAVLAAATATLSTISSDSRTARIFSRFSALGATMGNRQTGSSSPIKLIAAFTGIGFDSTKLISISVRYFLWIVRAPAKSPASPLSQS